MRKPLIGLSLLALLGTAACGSGAASSAGSSTPASTGHSFVVVTDIYPTTFAVEQVAGDSVEVVQLAPAGVEPHDYELTPKQVQQIADADLVAYLPGMIPAVEEAIAQEAAGRSVDVSTGVTRLEESHAGEDENAGDEAAGGDEHAHEGGDPHIWLDPTNMAQMGQNVADALSTRGVAADAQALSSDMEALDGEFRTALATCAIPTMVVNHEAFAYLAKAYGFTQVGISGLSPEAEPTPAKMAEITDLVRSEGITTIYFESLVSPAAAETIASETGVATALLDPIEGNTDGAGYPTIMRANAATLHSGQSCS